MANMNEDLTERFGRSRKGHRQETNRTDVWILPQRLNLKVREYFENVNKPVVGGPWLDRPEIPTAREILDFDSEGSSNSSVVELVANKPKGAWASKGEPRNYFTLTSHKIG